MPQVGGQLYQLFAQTLVLPVATHEGPESIHNRWVACSPGFWCACCRTCFAVSFLEGLNVLPKAGRRL
jgi:hypothetical protein